MSNSFCAPSSSSGRNERKASDRNSGSLNYAKSFLRRLYSTSTSTLGRHASSGRDSMQYSSAEFKAAISPFFQIRMPEPEERPYLPYNIYYQVEEESGKDKSLSRDHDECDTDAECTLAEDLTLTSSLYDGIGKKNNAIDNPQYPSSNQGFVNENNGITERTILITNNSTDYMTQIRPTLPVNVHRNKTLDERLLRRKQMPEPCLDYSNASRTQPIVYGRRNQLHAGQYNRGCSPSNMRQKCAEFANALTMFTQKSSAEAGNEKLIHDEENGTQCRKDASLNDSSSLGYSTMSSSAYSGSRMNEDDADNGTSSLVTEYMASQRKNSRSMLADSHSVLKMTCGFRPTTPHCGDKARSAAAKQWNNSEAFSDWEALFQFLKSEIGEIHKRDTKIRQELAKVERHVRGTATSACCTPPT